MEGDRVSADRFRDLMSCFPTGVAVVTAVDSGGQPRGMTCSSLASVCLDPPTLLISLRTGSPTLDAVVGRLEFSVNLLHAHGRPSAEVFASPVVDRFAAVRWKPSRRGLPWLVDHSAASADCRVAGYVPVGDHTVVFGEVLEVGIDWGRNPLIYGKRQYTAWQQAAVDSQLPTARRRK